MRNHACPNRLLNQSRCSQTPDEDPLQPQNLHVCTFTASDNSSKPIIPAPPITNTHSLTPPHDCGAPRNQSIKLMVLARMLLPFTDNPGCGVYKSTQLFPNTMKHLPFASGLWPMAFFLHQIVLTSFHSSQSKASTSRRNIISDAGILKR
jgi:hypothetical protein